jgi:cysteine-rich repeat protein
MRVQRLQWAVSAAVVLAACGDSGGDTGGSSFGGNSTTAASMTTMTTGGEASTGAPTGGEASTGEVTATGGATSTGAASSSGGAVCGDGVVDPGEACDDGNTDDADGCTNACALPGCGDGIVAGDEQCDDGNTEDNDACTSACKPAACGDGFIQAGVEACDDGNADDTDDCLSTCVAAKCGDGAVQAGVEACDDGNADDTDDCTSTCAAAKCGDGFVQAGVEGCDDANADSSDGCLATCAVATSCKQIKAADPGSADGLYMVDLDGDGPLAALSVFCNQDYDGGGWMLVGKTIKAGLTPDEKAKIYMGGWDAYTKDGYGSPANDSRIYWMPLALWHTFTNDHLLNEFYVEDSATKLRMNNMTIGDAAGKFKINWATPVQGFGEVVAPIKGAGFTTHDQDNDVWGNNCAKDNVGYNGGWWYTNCYQLSMLHSNGNIYSWNENIVTSVNYLYLYLREK